MRSMPAGRRHGSALRSGAPRAGAGRTAHAEQALINANLIVERLGAVFTRTFHVAAPSPDTDLAESGVLDPFQIVELLLRVEAHFNLCFRIDDFSLDDLRTLAGIARLVATHGGAARQAVRGHLRARH